MKVDSQDIYTLRIDPIRAEALQHGLVIRGGFNLDQDDNVPDIGEQVAAKSLLLVGNAGSSIWASFSGSDEYHDGHPDPLNRWSERIGHALADKFGGQALFPFGGPPYQPFLRWAKKAESLQNSRLGMLIHPQYGLWHAYRFALAFPIPVGSSATGKARETATAGGDICRQCEQKPCLSTSPIGAGPVNACPVNAFETGYDVQSCYRYLESHPDSKCMTTGCQARIACPQGAQYHYEPTHAAFHMRAFIGAGMRGGDIDRPVG